MRLILSSKQVSYRLTCKPVSLILSSLKNKDRLSFIGKEKDFESKLGDFGVRKYEDFSGRFTSPDPLWEKYYGWSPYQYCFNNPIRLKDDNGLLPGDPFKSPAQAAHDFGKNYNPLSINMGREFGASIYKISINNKTMFTYSIPEKGTNSGTNVSLPPNGKQAVADVHSHGKYLPTYLNNIFSPQDKTDNKNKNIDGYLVTPDGSLKKYEVKSGLPSVITTDMPSDPNDPNRKNDVKPVKTETRPVKYEENNIIKSQ